MENEKTYLQNLILNRRIVRNYIDSDKPYPDLSEISKLTIKIPTAGFSRGIEIISVEDKKNIQKLAIFANEINYLDKGFSKWISNSKAIFLILINEEAYHERYKMMDKENETNSTNWSVPYWYVDAGAAMMNCMLIEEKELSSGFMGLHNIDRKKIHEEFKIPDTYQIIGMITAGVEDSNTDISKNKHNKKKLIHNEFFSR